MSQTVFVSYSVKDKPAAEAVVARLETAGVSCWIAPRDVLPGADWGASILDAIEAAKIMVLIFSGNANASPQIKREVERAVNHDTYLIPLRLDETTPTRSLEYFISTPQWMDAFPPPLENHLDRLVKAVHTVLTGERPDAAADEPAEKREPTKSAIPQAVADAQPQVSLGVASFAHQVPMPSAQGPSIGMRIAVPVSLTGAKNKTLQVVAKFSYANGPPLWAHPQEMLYRDPGGVVTTGTQPRVITTDNEPVHEESMLIPYYALNFPPTNGFSSYNLAFIVFAYLDNQPVAQSVPAFFGLRW